jgi:hypothetical protein
MGRCWRCGHCLHRSGGCASARRRRCVPGVQHKSGISLFPATVLSAVLWTACLLCSATRLLSATGLLRTRTDILPSTVGLLQAGLERLVRYHLIIPEKPKSLRIFKTIRAYTESFLRQASAPFGVEVGSRPKDGRDDRALIRYARVMMINHKPIAALFLEDSCREVIGTAGGTGLVFGLRMIGGADPCDWSVDLDARLINCNCYFLNVGKISFKALFYCLPADADGFR